MILEDFTDRVGALYMALKFDDVIAGAEALGGEIAGAPTVKVFQKAVTSYFNRAKKEQEHPAAIARHVALRQVFAAQLAQLQGCSGLSPAGALPAGAGEAVSDSVPDPALNRDRSQPASSADSLPSAGSAVSADPVAAPPQECIQPAEGAAALDADEVEGTCDGSLEAQLDALLAAGDREDAAAKPEPLIPLGMECLSADDAKALLRRWIGKHGAVNKDGTDGRGFVEKGTPGKFLDPPRRKWRFNDGAWVVLKSTDGSLDRWRVDKSSEWTATTNEVGRLTESWPVGRLLGDARQAAGVEVGEVAVKLRVTDGTIRAIEEGRGSLSTAQIVQWCRACGIDPRAMVEIANEWLQGGRA